MEKTVQVKTLFTGQLINLKIHQVLLAGNRTAKREIVEHPGAVTILPIVKNSILFVRQYRKAVEEEVLELPAGTREEGEEVFQTARRELLEETGYQAGRLTRYSSFYSSPGYSSEEIHLFLAEDLRRETEPGGEVDEDLQVVLLQLEEVLQMLMAGFFHDGKTIAALALYFLQQRETP